MKGLEKGHLLQVAHYSSPIITDRIRENLLQVASSFPLENTAFIILTLYNKPYHVCIFSNKPEI
jgi:hypothetical protein